MQFLILQNPGHNRVYFEQSDKLAFAELKIAGKNLSEKIDNIKSEKIAGVRYISFEKESELTNSDIFIISKLSFTFAIFNLISEGGIKKLIPVNILNYEYLDKKLSSILKYQGKTNELFTQMMVNVAVHSSDFSMSDQITLLDPVAGKGTTLFEGLIYGFSCYGIEKEAKFVHETSVFFKKFLQKERLKHLNQKRQVSGSSKKDKNEMFEFEFAKDKELFKDENKRKKLGIVCGKSQESHKYFKKPTFNLIVGDLPYGIFHGNTNANGAAKSRNPKDFLKDSIPEWIKVLKTGGCIAISWNSFLISYQEIKNLFSHFGLNPLNSNPYDSFEHMVDSSIKRDLIVAKKTF